MFRRGLAPRPAPPTQSPTTRHASRPARPALRLWVVGNHIRVLSESSILATDPGVGARVPKIVLRTTMSRRIKSRSRRNFPHLRSVAPIPAPPAISLRFFTPFTLFSSTLSLPTSLAEMTKMKIKVQIFKLLNKFISDQLQEGLSSNSIALSP